MNNLRKSARRPRASVHALIIANGPMPELQRVRELVRRADVIICADGGANAARKLGLRPHLILGDLDSISPSTRRYYRDVNLLRVPDQNSTDLEKALRHAIDRGIGSADIIGATGGRLDHTAGAFFSFRKFGRKINMHMHDGIGSLTMVNGTSEFRTGANALVSLLPVVRCSGVSTTNLLYPLRNAVLVPGGIQGISNRTTAGRCTVTCRQGTLLVFIPHPDVNVS